jgi:hypothetical protein
MARDKKGNTHPQNAKVRGKEKGGVEVVEVVEVVEKVEMRIQIQFFEFEERIHGSEHHPKPN